MLWKIWQCPARLFHVEHCQLLALSIRRQMASVPAIFVCRSGIVLIEVGVYLLSLAGSEDLFHVEHKASLRFNLSVSNSRNGNSRRAAPAPLEKSRSISGSGARRNQKRERMSCV